MSQGAWFILEDRDTENIEERSRSCTWQQLEGNGSRKHFLLNFTGNSSKIYFKQKPAQCWNWTLAAPDPP